MILVTGGAGFIGGNFILDWFTAGMRKTVAWYLENSAWADNVTSGAYRDWMSKQYGA